MKKYVCQRLFFIKVSGCRLKKTSVQVRYCEFCVISKNDYLVEHVHAVDSDTLGYTLHRVSPARSILKKCTVFSSLLTLIHLKLILRVLQNLKGVFRTISNIYDEAFSQKYLTAFSRCIFTEMLHHRYLIGFCIRLCNLVFYNLPLSSFGYLNERYEHGVITRKVCRYFPHMR